MQLLVTYIVRFLLFVMFSGGLGAEFAHYWPFWVEDYNSWRFSERRIQHMPPIYEAKQDGDERVITLRPIGTSIRDCKTGAQSDHILPPLLAHTFTQHSDHWNILNLIKFGCITAQRGHVEDYVTIFPLFFYKNAKKAENSYFGIFPIAGEVKNYFGTDSIRWGLFPGYLGVECGGVTKHHLPWPIIRWQEGPCAGGFGIWPLGGHFYQRNHHSHTFYLWPLGYRNWDKLDTCEPSYKAGFLPFYAYENSAKKEMTQYLWPFFGSVEMKKTCYKERHYFWPLLVQGRGPTRYTNRWAPIYSHSYNRGTHKYWFFWPLLKIKSMREGDMHILQEQLLMFLFWKQTQTSCRCPDFKATKMHLWPLFSYWDNGNGEKQFQMLSPLEVFFPTNRAVREIYSPIFAPIRASSPAPGYSRQSILYDLISAESTPEGQRFSIAMLLDVESERGNGVTRFDFLKGLLGYENCGGEKAFKFLWMRF